MACEGSNGAQEASGTQSNQVAALTARNSRQQPAQGFSVQVIDTFRAGAIPETLLPQNSFQLRLKRSYQVRQQNAGGCWFAFGLSEVRGSYQTTNAN